MAPTIVHLSKPGTGRGAVRTAFCGTKYALAGSYAARELGLPNGTSNPEHASCVACLEAELAR